VRVLIVEDEKKIVGALKRGLEAEGFAVDVALNGTDGLWMATENGYDVIVLDIMLPGMNGFKVCENLREARDWTPILMLTAKDGEYDQAEALDTGADDYLTKPFSPAELVARVKAVLRRVDGAAPPEVVQAGRVTIDIGRREIRIDDAAVEFTTKEFDLLRYLAERPGLALSRQQILDGVWGYGWYGDARTVDVHIAQVRKKAGDALTIKTVRGVGYRLESS
jgi:two-component system OmpR family response regulator